MCCGKKRTAEVKAAEVHPVPKPEAPIDAQPQLRE